jgi:flagellar hook-associated protein 1
MALPGPTAAGPGVWCAGGGTGRALVPAMADPLLIALSALTSQQRAMQVTSHNIANAATPGYARQRAELTTPGADTGDRPGPSGRGVMIEAIRRVSDAVMTERLRGAQSEAGRLDTLVTNLKAVEAAFNEPGDAGLSATIDRLFGQLQDLSGNPESTALRSTVVQQLQGFTNGMNALGARVEGLLVDIRSAFTSTVDDINNDLAQLAELNQQIRFQVTTGGEPNDLLDRRDLILQELSQNIQLDVRIDPGTQAALVGTDGRSLIGSSTANLLGVIGGETLDNPVRLLGPGNFQMPIVGGRLAALDALQRELVPDLLARLDLLSATMAREMNAGHSISTSQAQDAESWTSAAVIPADATWRDLDDPALAQAVAGGPGITAAFAPRFVDATGAPAARNLTINVADTVSGTARKMVVRYEPGAGPAPATRSLEDLVAAINTGRGGGFTLHPSGPAVGLTARMIAVSDGFRLQIQAEAGSTVDFSPALDLAPAAGAWSSPTVTVAGAETTAPPLRPDSRITVRVAAGGQVEAMARDPATGQETILGSVAIPVTGAATLTVLPGITLTVPAGTYRAGDRFAVALDAAGAVVSSGSSLANTHVQETAWPASDATFQVKGRVTNPIGFDPAQPWNLRVVTAGVVGAKAGTAVPNNPPVIEVTYRSGPAEAPVVSTRQITLDETLPAGAPVAVVDGVYLTFTSGVLSQVDAHADFIVDGDPDQAGLLGALGINTLFSGSTAASLAVDERVIADPSRLNVARSRAPGDNSGLLALVDLRSQRLMPGSFTIEDYYQAGLADVGVRVQGGKRQGEIQESLKRTLQGQRDQMSGVNIDEEVGTLILQQQAYSAAARVVNFARENIQTLLDLVR